MVAWRGAISRDIDRTRLGGARSAIAALSAATVCASMATSVASAQLVPNQVPEQARGLDVVERLGERARLETRLTDWRGEPVTLDKYFNQVAADGNPKPVILALVYYECPLVCDLVRERLLTGMNGLGFSAGEDYNLVVVSFDSAEPYRLAANARRFDLIAYSRDKTPEIEGGFAYHVAEPSEVRALAESVGFAFRLLDNGEYSHPVALTVLTPEGDVARYFYGFEYPSQDLRLALLEASEGTIAESIGDAFVMFCYTFDPTSGTYTLQAWRVMQIGAIASVVGLSALVGGLFVNDHLRRGRRARASVVGSSGDGVGAADGREAGIG